MARSGKGPVKRGVSEFVDILEGYDFFRWSREHMTATTNLMLALAVATLFLTWYQLPCWSVRRQYREIPGVSRLLLFGISACSLPSSGRSCTSSST